MILRLKENKKLSFYQKNPIYIGEKDFDIIEVLIPPKVDNNNTEDLNFILHIVNKKGEYIHINLKKEQQSNGTVGITRIDTTITNEIQDFFLYLEMIKGEKEIIGKTNCIEITIEPLPDEDTRIIPKEEYEEIIDELTEIIQKNTNAMNRINGFQDGKSAYEIAVDNGYVGSEEEWLESLKGTDGTDGVNGVNGKDGLNGADGLSAYEIAVDNGFSGTEAEWLLSLKGGKGDSVSSAVVNQNGTITFTSDDGSTFTTTGSSVIGSDGFSPTISTSSEYLRTRVEITDVNGTQYFYINDGESVKSAVINANGDLIITIKGKPTSGVRPTYPERIYNVGHVVGDDGYSPTATVTQTQNGATVSITDKNGTTTANISNGVNGSNYILTAQDKTEIADLVLAELPTTQGVQYGNTGN